MKKRIVWLIALLLAPGTVAYASPDVFNAGLSINLPGFGFRVGPAGVGLNIGLPWVVAPEPAYVYQQPGYAYQEPVSAYQQSDYAYQPVVIEEPPEFVLPPELGFYVAVGVPYDLFYFNNVYYVCRDNIWYSSPYYYGPWSRTYYGNIPYALSRYPFERIRHYRDNYYGRYQRYGAWDGYRHFRPERHGGHAGFRKDYDRTRHTYGNAYRPNQGYGNRPAFNRPNRDWQVNGTGRTYTRPVNRDRYDGDSRTVTRPYYNGYNGQNRSGQTYNRPDYRYRDNRDSRTVTRPYYNGQVNAGRPAYSRPNRPEQWSGNRPASISPFNFAPGSGNRPAYNRPTRSGQFYGNGSSYTRPNAFGQGSGGRPAYYRTNNSRQAEVGRPAYTRPNGPAQGSMGRRVGHDTNRSGQGTRGWQGQGGWHGQGR